MTDKRIALLIAGVAATAALFGVFAQRQYDFGADPGTYAGLAQSLASGRGYVFNGRPHTQYPPGYPLLLVPVTWVSGGDYATLSRFTAALAAIGIVMVAWYGRVRRDRWWFVPAIMLLVSVGHFTLVTAGTMSDGPFLLASVVCLAWFEHLSTSAERARRVASWCVAAALCIAVVLLRTIGIAMVGGLAITAAALLWRARAAPRRLMEVDTRLLRAAVAALVAGIVATVVWMSWTSIQRETLFDGEFMDAYQAQFSLRDPHRPDLGVASLGDVLARAPAAVVRQSAHLAELMTNYDWVQAVWYNSPVYMLLVLVTIGVVIELRRANPLMGWYLLCYLAVLSVWPFDEGTRFVVPILPLAAICAGQGLMWLVRPDSVAARRARLGLATVAAAALIATTVSTASGTLSTQGQLAAVPTLILLAALWRGHARSWSDSQVAAATRVLLVVFVCGFGVLGIRGVVLVADNRLHDTSRSRTGALDEAAAWLRNHAPPDATVMAFRAAGLHFATGLRTVPFPVTEDPERLGAAFSQLKPDYLLVEHRRAYEYFHPTQQQRLGIIRANSLVMLAPVAQFRDADLFRVALSGRSR